MMIPVLFYDRLEAQVVLVVFLASFALMILLTAWKGFTRILGLGHILWIPLIVFLWNRLGEIPIEDFFGWWVRALIGVNLASLILDTADVIRYANGNRLEMVEGLES